MLTIPAFVWRGGAIFRAITVGLGVGVFLGLLSWMDSGLWFAGLIAMAVVALIYGVWLGRRMVRFWPGASALTGEQRVRVAGVTRWGGRMGDPALAQAVVEYADGLHNSEKSGRAFRWVVPLVLVVALGVAFWDAMFGSTRDLVSSCVYLVLLGFELFWWPGRRNRLLVNADRAKERALGLIESTEGKAT
jgi:flagellar biosynthesis protein FliQ